MKYKIRWKEEYETELEAEENLSDEEVYDLIDFNNKNCFYSGLYDLEVEEIEDVEE